MTKTMITSLSSLDDWIFKVKSILLLMHQTTSHENDIANDEKDIQRNNHTCSLDTITDTNVSLLSASSSSEIPVLIEQTAILNVEAEQAKETKTPSNTNDKSNGTNQLVDAGLVDKTHDYNAFVKVVQQLVFNELPIVWEQEMKRLRSNNDVSSADTNFVDTTTCGDTNHTDKAITPTIPIQQKMLQKIIQQVVVSYQELYDQVIAFTGNTSGIDRRIKKKQRKQQKKQSQQRINLSLSKTISFVAILGRIQFQASIRVVLLLLVSSSVSTKSSILNNGTNETALFQNYYHNLIAMITSKKHKRKAIPQQTSKVVETSLSLSNATIQENTTTTTITKSIASDIVKILGLAPFVLPPEHMFASFLRDTFFVFVENTSEAKETPIPVVVKQQQQQLGTHNVTTTTTTYATNDATKTTLRTAIATSAIVDQNTMKETNVDDISILNSNPMDYNIPTASILFRSVVEHIYNEYEIIYPNSNHNTTIVVGNRITVQPSTAAATTTTITTLPPHDHNKSTNNKNSVGDTNDRMDFELSPLVMMKSKKKKHNISDKANRQNLFTRKNDADKSTNATHDAIQSKPEQQQQQHSPPESPPLVLQSVKLTAPIVVHTSVVPSTTNVKFLNHSKKRSKHHHPQRIKYEDGRSENKKNIGSSSKMNNVTNTKKETNGMQNNKRITSRTTSAVRTTRNGGGLLQNATRSQFVGSHFNTTLSNASSLFRQVIVPTTTSTKQAKRKTQIMNATGSAARTEESIGRSRNNNNANNNNRIFDDSLNNCSNNDGIVSSTKNSNTIVGSNMLQTGTNAMDDAGATRGYDTNNNRSSTEDNNNDIRKQSSSVVLQRHPQRSNNNNNRNVSFEQQDPPELGVLSELSTNRTSLLHPAADSAMNKTKSSSRNRTLGGTLTQSTTTRNVPDDPSMDPYLLLHHHHPSRKRLFATTVEETPQKKPQQQPPPQRRRAMTAVLPSSSSSSTTTTQKNLTSPEPNITNPYTSVNNNNEFVKGNNESPPIDSAVLVAQAMRAVHQRRLQQQTKRLS